MKNYLRFGLLALVLAAALALASCGGSGSGGGSQSNESNDTSGMDHSGKVDQKTGGMAGMDHGSGEAGSGDMARQMVMENGEYSDERFIDAMVPHHQGAVEMAEVALKNAEHEEVRSLAEDIVTAQEAEIEELKTIKEEEFGTSEVPTEMDPEQMQSMGMMMDPQRLANQEPFDKAFIDAMIPHHESAIEMAQVAQNESDLPEIKELSRNIIEAQRREISQMQGWRERWYPEG
jgi:uncharacterized protein (DUF305 family)